MLKPNQKKKTRRRPFSCFFRWRCRCSSRSSRSGRCCRWSTTRRRSTEIGRDRTRLDEIGRDRTRLDEIVPPGVTPHARSRSVNGVSSHLSAVNRSAPTRARRKRPASKSRRDLGLLLTRADKPRRRRQLSRLQARGSRRPRSSTQRSAGRGSSSTPLLFRSSSEHGAAGGAAGAQYADTRLCSLSSEC